MTQTFWDTEATDRQQQEQSTSEQFGEPVALALSADDFSALEERIVRAVELVKRERLARAEAEERAARAEAQLGDQAQLLDQLKQEVRALRTERDHVRQRVERLLSQLDALEL